MLPVVAGILPTDHDALTGNAHLPDLIGFHLADIPAHALTFAGGTAVSNAKRLKRVRAHVGIEHHSVHAR